MIDTQTKTYTKPKSDPCRCAEPKPDRSCCDLICFERPNYFCGHLLTDTDLSTEQHYAIEKRKLHNRTLHGWGVVCGLRMTCDPECGGVMIDEGYAIDDCGNDLVVCEPLRFDVIRKLREKGYMVGDAAYDPCRPKEEQDDCKITQCFYITACYDEQPGEFTTPFVAGCRPSLTECEPTRIREGVRFDILCELPKKHTWLDELKCRIEECIKLFTEGQFANALKENIQDLTTAVNQGATPDQKWWELFCKLRGFLLLYLSKHPDKYNCTLDYEIRKIPFPHERPSDTDKPLPTLGQGQSQGQTKEPRTHLGENYAGDLSAAFCRLLELAHQHVFACILGELVFPCKEPCEPACVVLGTVEVVGDKVVQVCNCPRSYVWSFGSFWEVLVATLLGGLACEESAHLKDQDNGRIDPATGQPTGGTPGTFTPSGNLSTSQPPPQRFNDRDRDELKRVCCTEAKFDCQEFVRRLQANQKTILDGSTATLSLISELTQSLRHAFDFTRPEVISPNTVIGMKVDQAQRLAKDFELDLQLHEAPLVPQELDPFQKIRSHFLSGTERTMHAFHTQGQIVEAKHEWRAATALDPAIKAQFDNAIAQAASETAALKKQVTELEARLKENENRITQLNTATEPKITEIRQKIMETLAAEPKKPRARKPRAKKPAATKPEPGTEGGENG